MARYSKTNPRPVELLPAGFVLGGLIRYYHNGWRTGTLQEFKNGIGSVSPIGGKLHARARKVALADLEAISGTTNLQSKGDNAIT